LTWTALAVTCLGYQLPNGPKPSAFLISVIGRLFGVSAQGDYGRDVVAKIRADETKNVFYDVGLGEVSKFQPAINRVATAFRVVNQKVDTRSGIVGVQNS